MAGKLRVSRPLGKESPYLFVAASRQFRCPSRLYVGSYREERGSSSRDSDIQRAVGSAEISYGFSPSAQQFGSRFPSRRTAVSAETAI